MASLFAGEEDAWVPDQVMVSLRHDAELEALARDHGAAVVRERGRSGYGVLAALPGGAENLAEALRSDERVLTTAPHARIYGAGKGGGKGGGKGDGGSDGTAQPPASLVELQWHLGIIGTPSSVVGDLSSVVVAVLDTGVAYEARSDATGTYAAAASLSGSAIVAPWDFVNDDDHAGDDHQHGTHIASTIASNGEVVGVAPGAALMPLKVLDENNQGYESDLVEAIYWAVDNGADVINLSLSFGQGYVPGAPLLAALDLAATSGVVLVGAAGNEAHGEVTWPAASPQVLAVGSYHFITSNEGTDYTNRGFAMDILAPGGDLDVDTNSVTGNGDGYPDGILAESIALQEPDATGYWFMAGTSQSAAIASGAVARLLAAGEHPEEVIQSLQRRTRTRLRNTSLDEGLGYGPLFLEGSLDEARQDRPDDEESYHVSVLPYLVDNGDGTVTPTARLTTMIQAADGDIAAASGVEVRGRVFGSTTGDFVCDLRKSSRGECTVSGPAIQGGSDAALAWRFTVEMVTDDYIAWHPGRLLFASDGLDAAAGAMPADAVLAYHWGDGAVAELGTLAESYSVMDSGSGITTSPMGLLLTPPVLPPGVGGETVSVDGSGISTSPFSFKLLNIDGSGISTSPFSRGITLATFDGSGISTSPFSAVELHTLEHAVGATILMDQGVIDGAAGASIEAVVSAGGWVSADGYQGASHLIGLGVVEVLAEPVGAGSGLGAMPLE